MKQIYSVLTAMAVIFSCSAFAQTVTISTINPNPTPAFTSPVDVTLANGFSTTSTGAFNEFPKNKTTTLTSPQFFYTAPQSIVYFKYNVTIAMAGGTSYVSTPIATISYGAVSIPMTAVAFTVPNGTTDYYFTAILPAAIPAMTNFRIALTMDVPNNDRAIRANNLTTNAQLAPSAAPIPLPVKLVSFQGAFNKNQVQLSWLIAENETAKSFEVQRSTNGTDFYTVTTIAASSKTGDENYNFSETTSSARVLYRLKMFDVDGKAEYSKTLVFNAAASKKSLQVLTNPVKDKLVISFVNETAETAQVIIYDNQGRTMQRQSLNTYQGINTNTVVLNGNYKSGLYIVELVTKSARLSEKIIYSNQ